MRKKVVKFSQNRNFLMNKSQANPSKSTSYETKSTKGTASSQLKLNTDSKTFKTAIDLTQKSSEAANKEFKTREINKISDAQSKKKSAFSYQNSSPFRQTSFSSNR